MRLTSLLPSKEGSHQDQGGIRRDNKVIEGVPPLKHIPVIVETADYNPVIIYAEASPNMSNNTISRKVVKKLGRESEIQFRESKYKTRREYLVMAISKVPRFSRSFELGENLSPA